MLQVVYHLWSPLTPDWLRVICDGLPRDDPRLPSVTFLWKGAEWAEREAYDMFGIIFEGNRDLRRIYMPPDYQSFPLRKDFLMPDDASRSPGLGVRPMEIAFPTAETGRQPVMPAQPRHRVAGHRPARAAGRSGRAEPAIEGGAELMAAEPRVRSLDDPSILVDSPATIIDAVPPYPPRTEREAEFYSLRDGEMFVNLGPQHPSTHGVLRVVIKIDGEQVVDLDPVLGYLHRGVEKICENGDWHHAISNCDPLEYIASMFSEAMPVLVAEKLLDLEVPRRAEYIRVLAWELNRISSHALFIGWLALDLGGMTPILYGFIERDEIVEMLAALTGQKLLFNYLRIGGVNGDLNHEFLSRLGDWMSHAGEAHRGRVEAHQRERDLRRPHAGAGCPRPRDRAPDLRHRAAAARDGVPSPGRTGGGAGDDPQPYGRPGGTRFAVLGPMRAWRGGEPLPCGAPQQRALLAALLLRAAGPPPPRS